MRADHLAVFVTYWRHEIADEPEQVSKEEADTVQLHLGRRDNTGEEVFLAEHSTEHEDDLMRLASRFLHTFECDLIVVDCP